MRKAATVYEVYNVEIGPGGLSRWRVVDAFARQADAIVRVTRLNLQCAGSSHRYVWLSTTC